MAEEQKTNATASAAKPKAKGGGKRNLILFMVMFGISFWFIFPTLILFMIGMSPTFIAMFTDTDDNRSGSTTVGMMNAAGVAPFLIDLWTKGQTIENVFMILRNPTNWLIMLGAAGIGQLIYFAVPQAVALLTFARDDARLKILRANLESLRDMWGPEVGSTKPLDKLGKME